MRDASPSDDDVLASTAESVEPSPTAVREALRAVATGAAPTRRSTFAETVAAATAATDCAVEAAEFITAGRLAELARAVSDAEAAGADDVAHRGARALRTLRRLDAAAAAADSTTEGETPGVTASAPDSETDAPGPADDDHFHRARGTVLPPTGQPIDR